MSVDIRGVKSFIDHLVGYLSAERIECPVYDPEVEALYYYIVCCRSHRTAKTLIRKWDRFPRFRTGDPTVRPHPINDWHKQPQSGRTQRAYYIGEDDFSSDSAPMLILNVVFEEQSEKGTFFTIHLFDSEDKEPTLEDGCRGFKFGFMSDEVGEVLRQNNPSVQLARADFDLTDGDLRWLDKFSIRLMRNKSGDEETILRCLFLSSRLLSSYLGEAWVTRNLWEFKKGRIEPFNFSEGRDFVGHRLLIRSLEFAEMLYNFQAVLGMRDKVNRLRTENVESGLGELQGAQMLYASGRDIAFVVPSHVKGKDYDVDVCLSDGTRVACEMKSKIETTSFSQQTVERSIEKACAQLPKDRPTAVFLKMPEHWFDQIDAEEVLSTAIANVFRQRTSVSAVFLHWETWQKYQAEGVLRKTHYEKYLNSNAAFQHPELAELVKLPLTRYKRLTEIIDIPDFRFVLKT